ncbi:uncharacterized protein TRIVIDRAFT_195192 [Trichoderma virens Gv29-8]|uniref:Transcription factor domain-containing protein n=1 Tax=Hypocrea virens (strain Gv29-8 / FGSC 10586) TaxID=413071 RepID=G9N8A4_HYPVG|nr:uncharacterized protein TRIVIDRAFT_195192 [Trichoderma virens Gv29-8]EHK17213.1 hypothetical protein TRIVIDRAFT_195192 [Trichoderma virens Gv29-8]UKZ55630.1 hypothetical protein TrVGV298_009454 [Trichoderma virens]
MPRALNIAGDEASPICGQCTRSRRYCARPQKSSRWLAYHHPSESAAAANGAFEPWSSLFVYFQNFLLHLPAFFPCPPDLKISSPELTEPPHSAGAAGRTRFPSPESPRDALELPDVAWYFHNYITELAKWYDLGDALRQFATKVPELALDEPLLFSAVIALSAEHLCQTTGPKIAREMAGFYHSRCVAYLIKLDEKSELLTNGVALAAACLLRSYEILDEDIDPNRHLRGAYSLASCESSIAGSPPESLLAAGFWNYLREDITFSLFEGCPLKMDVTGSAAPRLTNSHDQLHSISLILGQIINKAFNYQISAIEWQQFAGMVHAWLSELPRHVKPFSRGSGPPRKPYPALVLHLTMQNLLGGKFIRSEQARQEVIRRLAACKRPVGWPVERLISSLKDSWAAAGLPELESPTFSGEAGPSPGLLSDMSPASY